MIRQSASRPCFPSNSLCFSRIHIWQVVLEVESLDALKHLYHDLPRNSFGDDVIDREVFLKSVIEHHKGSQHQRSHSRPCRLPPYLVAYCSPWLLCSPSSATLASSLRFQSCWEGMRNARLNLLDAFSQAMISVSSTSASSS